VAEHIDKEVEAIKLVLKALEPLAPEVRTNVLEYVLRRLQVSLSGVQTAASSLKAQPTVIETTTTQAIDQSANQAAPTHIKELKEQKRPRSANEMAALVAYYLANVVAPKDRKDKITTKEIDTYFKIAEFPLPEQTKFTLQNAKAAGYLDSVGNGEFKLNAVGYNLVVHSMPRGGRTDTPKKKGPRKTRSSSKKKKR